MGEKLVEFHNAMFEEKLGTEKVEECIRRVDEYENKPRLSELKVGPGVTIRRTHPKIPFPISQSKFFSRLCKKSLSFLSVSSVFATSYSSSCDDPDATWW